MPEKRSLAVTTGAAVTASAMMTITVGAMRDTPALIVLRVRYLSKGDA